MFKFLKNIGPGPLIAAAFIGPGTVTVCTLAGVNFGYALLWAMLLSIIATLILQEMAVRIGIITQKGVSEIIRSELSNPVLRWFCVLLILSAIVIGNAAYEAGNISGAVLGLETIFKQNTYEVYGLRVNPYSFLIGIIAFAVLYIGNYKILERGLLFLVVLMSVAFLVTVILTKPSLSEIFRGFVPRFPDQSILTIVALIGTTVVPYNLFLHASLVKEKWQNKSDLGLARKDTMIAVVLGGVISMAIIIAAASIQNTNITSAADLALGLEPVFGANAKYFLALGLFAAGITSAITAPLAAAYVARGCFGWNNNLKDRKFRAIWIFILTLGVLFSSTGMKSIEIIKFAQVANGILLPVIAGFLLWIMNKKSILGNFKNSTWQNIFGFMILAITIFLGLKSILKVLNYL